MSLRRYTWRAMQQRLGRTILTMLSIVIGVTAAVAVGLGTATTRNAYKEMFAMATGRASLEVSLPGGAAFSQDVLEKVVAVPGVVAAAPLIDRPTSLSLDGGERRVRMQLIGVDLARDRTVRDYTIVAGRELQGGDELVIEQGFADYLGLQVGDEVKLLTRRLSKPFTVVGLMRSGGGAALVQTALAFLPLDRAQFHFNRSGQSNLIDKIQLVTAAKLEPEKVLPEVAAVLPEGVQVHRPAANTQLMRETLHSSERGLTLTTHFSLLMAAFIIFNTFLMNVSERRRHLAIMRAIGATKRQIMRALISEALLLGAIGTAIGMLLGVVSAFLGTQLLAKAFDVQLPPLSEVITPWPFVLGAVFGLSLAYLGCRLPARIASRVSPLEGMNRAVETKSRNGTIAFLVAGSLFVLLGLGVIFGSIWGLFALETGSDAGLLILLGVVLLNGAFLTPQATAVAWLLRPLFPIESSLALKQVLRHHVRSALTVGVLFVAGSTGVGMANSILDCVRDVHDWHQQAIVGDYFVRAMMPDMATGGAADLPEGLGEELASVAHLQSLGSVAFVESKVPSATSNADEGLKVIVIARQFDKRGPAFDLVAGDRQQIGDRLRAGQVVIGSVLAQKLHLGLGDQLTLETPHGPNDWPICGIANEYLVGGLAVHMERELAVKWLDVQGVDGYVINADEGFRDSIRPALAQIAHKYDVFLLSQGDIRRNIDRIVRGVEWSLWLLIAMGFVVAAFGVVNTLTMNVLEQTRELGLLRIVAMTKTQVRRTIEAQALIIGGVGLPQGIVAGVAIAYVLNLGMMPTFGHSIAFHFYPRMVLGIFVVAFTIVLIAAFLPARRATRVDLVEALHYE